MQAKKPESKALEDNVVVVPTSQYVKNSIKEAIDEHAKSRNHPYATQVEPGFVTLSNETDSDSEITVATSKAVKVAYDLANTANQNALNNNANLYLKKDQNGADIPNKTEFVKNIGAATQQWVIDNGSGFINGNWINPATINDLTSWIMSRAYGGHAFRLQSNNGGTGYSWSCGYVTRLSDTWAGFVASYNYGVAIIHGNDGGGVTKISHLWTDKNTTISNGYLRTISPTIFIHPDGKFTTNDESAGATAERMSEGIYLIKGAMGFSNNGAIGSIEIPRCQNDLPMIWIDHEILPDGSIKLMTYHREHSNAPVFARNIKEGYSSGDLIDIPDGRFVSVRVRMPDIQES
ncbi:phage tail protein [Xenorhabdus sp. TH1]|uniref:phage tail protein n=1 Tax=Xenorhabdus sp. TH1 TaxID=3130166 RepID=UPI0030CFE43B